MQGRHIALSILLIGASLGGGIALERFHINNTVGGADDGPKIAYWVAPMDPNFRRDGPGKSPMGMDLIPVYEGDEPSGDPEVIEVSAREMNAIGVRTAVARIENVAQQIETVGFVGYDEHRISHVHIRAEGWIEDIRVRAIGDRVTEGDLLFSLFSPEVAIGSAELVRAVERRASIEIANARRKLESLGMSQRQMDELERTGERTRSLDVFAPQSGVVTALEAADGMFLAPATRAMTIADLTSVWLLADVFERDIGRLSDDAIATARFEHLPGRTFEGTVDYVYPELDRVTRTLPVRLKFDNADGLLKPNMYGTVSLSVPSTREVVTVPSEAVIRTGRAERVMLKVGEGRFRPRLVTTGLTDGFGESSRTEIVQGLRPGEEVVASAQFLIDSESALNAGLLRMAPTETEPAAGSGLLVALDTDRRRALIRHDAIPALDWPAMETAFTIRADVEVGDLEAGAQVKLAAVRGSDGTLALTELRASDGVDATGTGVVERVEPDGKLLLAHDPIPELAWPAMTMALPTEGVDLDGVPVGEPVSFDLAKAGGGLYVVVGVRRGDGAVPANAEAADDMRTMTVEGIINAIDAAARTANVTHGPLTAIGMPGMTMDFPLAEDLDPASIALGSGEVTIGMNDGGMVLAGATSQRPAMRTTGTVNGVDAQARTANITHGPLKEIGMPGMTMDFPLAPSIDAAELVMGEATFEIMVDGDGRMILQSVSPPPMRVEGTINNVDVDAGTANITHGPMAEIGMPGMTMDFALGDGVDPPGLPVGVETTLLMRREADFSLTLLGVADAGGEAL